jgi:hypothetical protein
MFNSFSKTFPAAPGMKQYHSPMDPAPPAALFYRNTFGQISGLINIAPAS